MADTFNGRKRIRKHFGTIAEVAEMPNLIEVQKSSYDDFLMVKEPPGGRADAGSAGRLQVGVPDLRFLRPRDARIRALRVRAAEIRRRRVPAARHDLCGAAEGEAAPDRVRCERGDRRQVGQGRQGAGRLHGRHAVHDAERHLRHQRHRARHRLARCTARRACSSITTRARRIPRASCCSPPASSPIAAPGSTSSSTPRTSSMCASTGAASCR